MNTTIDRPNRDALNKALDIYRDAMRPFIIRNLKKVRGQQVEDAIRGALNDRQAEQFSQNLNKNGHDAEASIDIGDFPLLISRKWNGVFQQPFGDERGVQNALWMIKEARDKAAHPSPQDIDLEFARTHLFHIADVLGKINAPEQKQAVETVRDRLTSPSSQGDTPTPAPAKSQPETPSSRPTTDLAPWRMVIRPNPDVALGTFQEAEFAADLQQVHDGRADATQYGNPVSFFNHTYITPGIRTLLVNTLKRLSGNGGDPVIQTKTGFGGGKTHSLIALYHLVNSTDALTNPSGNGQSAQTYSEIRGIIEEAGLDPSTGVQAHIAVLDGTYLSLTDAAKTPNGDPLNTLWGVMAYQLGGQDAYDLVGQAARQGTAPGGAQLDQLFAHVGPCVILIDELVAYVRNAGSAQDSILTFVQALTQAVRRNNNTALVVTLPESNVEAGSEAGMEALNRLEHLLGRIEAVWEPLETNEAFEVVRRRLFGNDIDEAARDRTCEAFAAMYSRARNEYPREVGEQHYLERLRACYPIHPEIFDRLYLDWSSITQFQRTRGVLRMMANCVSRLYLDNDASPLIMPANLTLSDTALANEFVRLLGSQWGPVLSEIDSNNSRTDNIDRASQRFGDVGGAARRIARTIFLGSSGSGAVKGIDARQIRLGVVQPKHGVSVYNDALSQISGDLYYLYSSEGRYYFHAEENLNKVATDRAAALSGRDINDHIVAQLQEAVGRRPDVIVCPANSGDVSDADEVRLVLLHPDMSLPSRASEKDDAEPEVQQMLQCCGDNPRVRRNTLLFLAARKDEIRDLNNRVKTFLAWHSIVNGDRRIENLSGDRLKQAQSSLRAAEAEVRTALVRAYRWAIAPVQDDPQKAEYRLVVSQIDATDGEIINNAFDKFIGDEALVETISPSALATMLKQYVWNNPNHQDHISIDVLWDMMTSYMYMHRLRSRAVLQHCIEQGVPDGAFGYAESYNEDQYKGMRFREQIASSSSNASERSLALLVNPEMAALVTEERAPQEEQPAQEPPPSTPTDGTQAPRPAPPSKPHGLTRIVASKTTANDVSLDDINQLREEIIRTLRDGGGTITVTITITADKGDGFSESTARAVRENSAQLGLDFKQLD